MDHRDLMEAPVSAETAAFIAGIVALVAFVAAIIGIRMFGRQLDPPEFTGDQGFDSEGRP